MSWHFLQGQEEASWEESCLDGAPCALSSLIPTAAGYCSPDSGMDSCRDSRSGTTSPRLTESRGAEASMWLAGDFPAKTYQSETPQGGASTEREADCGLKWRESFAKLSRDLSSWKIPQTLLGEGLDEFCGTWPQWGLMLGGECWEVAMPGPITNGYESGLPQKYPTPTTRDTQGPRGKAAQARKGNPMDTLPNVVGGVPHPRLSEWLLGWPKDVTDLKPLATANVQQWCDSHGISWEAQDDLS